MNLNERTAKEKIVHIIMRALRIAFWLCVIYFAFLSLKAGEYQAKPLIVGLLIIPAGIYNIMRIRKQYQGNTDEKKKFNKIFIRSILLSILIVTLFVIVSVIHIVYFR